MVKNLSAMQETWVRSLSREDLLEKGKATHSRGALWATAHRVTKSQTRLSDFHFTVLREGQRKCSGHMKKRELCLQENSGRCLWLGPAVVSWGLAMCIWGDTGRASTGCPFFFNCIDLTELVFCMILVQLLWDVCVYKTCILCLAFP